MFVIVAVRSHDYLMDGSAALAEGDTLRAVTFFERSALLYVPLTPYWKRSLNELKKISSTPQIYKRSFSRQAEAAIGRINGQLHPWSFGADTDNAAMKPAHRLAMHLAFYGWLVLSIAVFFKGFGKNAELKKKPAGLYLTASQALLAGWLYLLAL